MKNLLCFVLLVSFGFVQAQIIDNSKGIDPSVEYPSLIDFGPWDDRNYELTSEDLDWLSDTEAELVQAVPAFYRVMFRKKYFNTPKTGENQYPRSLLNYFLLRYEGYLVDGKIYEAVRWNEKRTHLMVDLESEAVSPGEVVRDYVRGLSNNVMVFSGAESAVSVSPIDPNLVVAGLNRNGQEMLFSSDAGQTWTSAPDLTGSECCDPAMEWNTAGTFAYNVTLGGSQVWFYRSDDNGQTWDSLEDITPGDNRRELEGPVNNVLDDKEYIHVDKSPTSPFQDNIYVTWHQGNILQFASSSDDGNTWNIVSFTSEPRGIGSDIVTGADGTIYHFWPATSDRQIRMNVSTDGGATFTPSINVSDTEDGFDFPIPSMDSRFVFIYNSVDMDLTGGTYNNRLYASWTDTYAPQSSSQNNHARIQVAHSDDFGATWSISNPHAIADQNEVDRWHQWLKVDKNGVVHVVFYDTRLFADRRGVDLFHSYSIDGAETWSTARRVTTESSPASTGFQFGDYNGLDFGVTADSGIAIFSDNRVEGGGGNDMDVYVAPVELGVDLIFANGFESPVN